MAKVRVAKAAAAKAPVAKDSASKLIYDYFIESTMLRAAFRALLDSFVKEDKILNLNPSKDSGLIFKLINTMNQVWHTSSSTIINDEQALLNAFWRVLGYTIQGKEKDTDFPKVDKYNTEFNTTLEVILANIVDGLIDNRNPTANTSNPAALGVLLNKLKLQLRDRATNTIPALANYWGDLYEGLIDLLDNNDLMKALSINTTIGKNGEERGQRLIRLGEKVGVPVPAASESFFLLAEKMEEFLKLVEETDWNNDRAAELYKENTFKDIAFAWAQVTGKNFFTMALTLRNRVPA